MRRNQLVTFIVLTAACFPAWAYIDPGTGSAVVSLIIGFFVAMGLTFKSYWYKLKALLTGQSNSAENSELEAEKLPEDSTGQAS